MKHIECEICGGNNLDVIELQNGDNETIALLLGCRMCDAIFTKSIEEQKVDTI